MVSSRRRIFSLRSVVAVAGVVILFGATRCFDDLNALSTTWDASTDATGDASPNLDAADAADVPAIPSCTQNAPPPPCNASDQPSGSGIFVSVASGDDTAGGTSQTSPVKTVTHALALAQAQNIADIYIDEGIYPEAQFQIKSATTLHGGWILNVTTWTRDCGAGFVGKTLLRSTNTTTVSVGGFTGTAGLDTLTLQATPAKAANDTSSYGVFVSGANIAFKMIGVNAYAVAAGDGSPAQTQTASGTTACDGQNDCSSGATGGAGIAGKPGTAGTFGMTGYVPNNGTQGGPGGAGQNGTAGQAGAVANNCRLCGPAPTCANNDGQTVQGDHGVCGCGGLGGDGGLPGHGGASSVGVFVAGSGTVATLTYSTIKSANGGAGSLGDVPPGGPASSGHAGMNQTCGSTSYNCAFNGSVCTFSGASVQGGGSGGVGGKGGVGGQGGGGAGGPSLALVNASGANATTDSTVCLGYTTGGAGAGGAPSGSSAPTN